MSPGSYFMDFKEFCEQEEPAMKPIIAVDMDGVLCDFKKAFKDLVGENIEPNEYEEKYGSNPFWSIISEAGEDFWTNMSWTPDGKVLWNFLKPFEPIILSAPSKDESSVTGKIKWLKRNIPEVNPENYITSPKKWTDQRVIFNSDKYLLVKKDKKIKQLSGEIKTRSRRDEDVTELENELENRRKNFILIDDTPKKVVDWQNAGGIGILHKNASDTISKLRKLLKLQSPNTLI